MQQEKLKSKLAVTMQKLTEMREARSDGKPLIDIIDKLKREKAQSELMMETSDLRLTKERAPNAIISHKKYENPHSCS